MPPTPPNTSILIREACLDDLAAIVAIYNSTIPDKQATADLAPVSVDSRRTWFDAHQQPHRPMYVLTDASDQVLAWATFSDYYPRSAYRISAEISLYVRADQRGRGLGRQLLQFMLALAPSLGIRNVLAVIFAHNHGSVALFEQHGFALWGTLPQVCDLDTRLADIVILGKRLPTEGEPPLI